jgi:hypothetical protein
LVRVVTKSGWQSRAKDAVNRGAHGRADVSVITCVVVLDERVILLSIYDKAEQADISDLFLQQLLDEAGL